MHVWLFAKHHFWRVAGVDKGKKQCVCLCVCVFEPAQTISTSNGTHPAFLNRGRRGAYAGGWFAIPLTGTAAAPIAWPVGVIETVDS